MKNLFVSFSLAIAALTACQPSDYRALEGQWYWTNDPEYMLDTLEWDNDLELDMERITINTDTGVVVTEYQDDSLINIRAYTKARIAEFTFDDQYHGVLSQYELDTLKTGRKGDLRYTAQNNNFRIFEKQDKSMMVLGYHFNQFGRLTDTLEFQVRGDYLIIRNDTLLRLKMSNSR